MSRDIAPRRHMPLWCGADKPQCPLHVTLPYEYAESVWISVGVQFEKIPLQIDGIFIRLLVSPITHFAFISSVIHWFISVGNAWLGNPMVQ